MLVALLNFSLPLLLLPSLIHQANTLAKSLSSILFYRLQHAFLFCFGYALVNLFNSCTEVNLHSQNSASEAQESLFPEEELIAERHRL